MHGSHKAAIAVTVSQSLAAYFNGPRPAWVPMCSLALSTIAHTKLVFFLYPSHALPWGPNTAAHRCHNLDFCPRHPSCSLQAWQALPWGLDTAAHRCHTLDFLPPASLPPIAGVACIGRQRPGAVAALVPRLLDRRLDADARQVHHPQARLCAAAAAGHRPQQPGHGSVPVGHGMGGSDAAAAHGVVAGAQLLPQVAPGACGGCGRVREGGGWSCVSMGRYHATAF